MRRITLWVLSTISTLVLLFSYHTSTSSTARAGTSIIAPQTTTATGSTATGSTTTGSSASGMTASGTTASGTGSTSAAATGSGSTATSGATAASETVDGSVVSTRFGNVQVQITVENGQITKSVVLQVPWNNQKDQQINARAVPTLNSEAVKAQSADIDMVSGATYTSEAYLQSLQSAIDRAHLS
jgi:uncharacterized protein with FMN-binding domain